MRGRHFSGHAFRSLRERSGLRARDLAPLVGCSHGHIRNIESSGDQPSDLLVHRFIRVLTEHLGSEVTVDDLSTPVVEDAA